LISTKIFLSKSIFFFTKIWCLVKENDFFFFVRRGCKVVIMIIKEFIVKF
jgi:hypothetical protein